MTLAVVTDGGLVADDDSEEWWEYAAGAAAEQLQYGGATLATMPDYQWSNDAGDLLWCSARRLAALIELVDEHGTRALQALSTDARADWADANAKLAAVYATLDAQLPPTAVEPVTFRSCTD